MKILQVPVVDLSHDPANARKHPERNLDTIVASLRRFGQQKPIVIDRNNIVRAGNGTLEAAKRLGWEKIDCVRTELNGADATAYAIADNRTAELAEWDDEVLAATLNGLALEEGLLEAAGYDEEELAAMLADGGSASNDQEAGPEITISPELHERQDYIVIVFDNSLDWTVATQRLNIKTEEAAQVETSTIKKTGVGRVITASQFFKAIGDE
jgi:hypothetical protein